ncbi:MAG: recombinase family protein [Oscillospiraceae bacterium]|nr:recombinase family protein [Oscillospiraceae bacterium]
MRNTKIAYTLYRVSTKKQVDKDRDDIPMQKQSCCEFAEKQGWIVGKEFEEKGISGYKVSAENRDAIQDLKDAATHGEFDVLLVFMFDRIGRIDDETPFVVEWFVKHGIEVWSVKEGEQRLDHHVDKLTNYIRFWQASGESEKTSMRTKTRLGQIVQEGRFRGGSAPYGYRLEKQGRFNKKNHELYEIMIDDTESSVVRMVFNLAYTQGYGSQRIASYLTEHGYRTRKSENFTNASVYHMLRNVAYTGVLRSGETMSEIFPDLQIITPEIFKSIQKQLEQRSSKYQDIRTIPLNTTGNSLLSGNIFCGHCGARLVVSTSGKKYVKKDGEITETARTRYVCYNKTRHTQKCDGQTGYTVDKLDKLIDTIVRGLFDRIGELPKESIVEDRYAEQIAELKIQLTTARAAHQAHSAEVREYETEVIKIIRGESKLDSELLNKLHDEARGKMLAAEQLVQQFIEKLENNEQMKAGLSQQFDNVRTWSDMYDECGIETKKMILSHIMKAVRVRRDYEIEIDLTVNCEELGICLEESVVSSSESESA